MIAQICKNGHKEKHNKIATLVKAVVEFRKENKISLVLSKKKDKKDQGFEIESNLSTNEQDVVSEESGKEEQNDELPTPNDLTSFCLSAPLTLKDMIQVGSQIFIKIC